MAVSQTTPSVDEASQSEQVVRIDEGFWRHKPALLWCTIACIGGFQLGLDLGSIAGLQAMPGFLKVFGVQDPSSVFGWNITPKVQQLISSLMSLGALVSCALTGPIVRVLSRKWTFVLAIFLNHLGVVLMMVATNVSTLYAGRFITGLANGLLDVIPQLYIHDSAPASQRGSLLGWFNVLVGLGLLVGSIVDNYTTMMAGKSSYLIPLGLFFVMPSVLGLLLPFMPETPRWLMEHNKPDKARHSLIRLRHKDTSSHLIDAELEEIRQALEREKEINQGIAIFDLFRGTNRRRTLLSFGLLCALPGTGSLFFLAYGTYFFAMAGQTKAFEEIVGVTAGGLFATLISLYLITRLGRRLIILSGIAVQGICMLIIATVYQTHPEPTKSTGDTLVAFVCIYLFAYNMCCAPYLYLCAGEIPSQNLRSYTLGIAIAIAFFGNWLISYTAPYFINTYDLNWGPKYGYIWFASNAIIFIWIATFVPETKGRTLEEIDEMFEARLPARKFKGYVCVESNHARQVGLHLVESKGEREGEVKEVENVGGK